MKKFLIIIVLNVMFAGLPAFAGNISYEYMNMEWWKNFQDEHLISNLSKLYEKNYDLKNAALKVKANEQVVKMQFAQELPSITFSGELSRDLRAPEQQFGKNLKIHNYSQYNYYFPVTAAYEVDIWGKNRLKTKSKKQQLEIIKQAERATYIALSSSFAVDYFTLIKTDKMLELQKELVETQERILNMTRDKHKIGLAPVTEVLYQEKILNSLKEEQNIYLKNQKILINNMRVYLADSEDDIERSDFSKVVLLKEIPEEYNSEVIENRPDYLQEEANLKRIGFDVRVAKKEFLPTFTIFGQLGLNSYHLSDWFNSSSQFFSAGILPNMDIFSGGRKIALLKMEKFRFEEALNNYKKTYIECAEEINSSLADYKAYSENYREDTKKLSSEHRIYNLLKDKKNIGNANELDVLFEKEVYLSAEKSNVSDKINTVISIIGLYKSVGGINLLNINSKTSDL